MTDTEKKEAAREIKEAATRMSTAAYDHEWAVVQVLANKIATAAERLAHHAFKAQQIKP